MQINRSNQQNHQTNFSAALANVNGWRDLRTDRVLSAHEVRKLYRKAKEKKGFELSAKTAFWGLAGRFSGGFSCRKVDSMAVVLTEKDATDFEKLISDDRQINFFNQILQGRVGFGRGLIISPKEGTDFIKESHCASA